MRHALTHVLVLGSIISAVACSDPLSPESIAGTYTATTFTLSGQVSGDVLAAGGNLTITLNADGTTSGSMLVPASLNDGVEFNADMAGTFSLADDSLTFSQDADTFVRDLAWTVNGSRIEGAGTFSDVTITVVLSRQ